VGVGVGVFGILVVVVWGEPDADFGGADGACDGADDFEGKAAAVLDGAAIGVSAEVDVVVEELLEEVAVCSVGCVSIGTYLWL